MTLVPGLAPGVAQLGTESAFEVLARARALEADGVDVVHLEIGQPDFPTPPHVIEEALAAMHRGETGYCPAPGIPELRAAAAEWLAGPRGLEIGAEEVLVATGAKPFLFFTVLACAGPGDEVLYPDPGFPIYRSAIAWTGARPVAIPQRARDGFAIDPEELATLITPRTRLVILNSPNNPTGAVLSAGDLEAVARVLERTDAWILADEVYAKILYETAAVSLASVAPSLRERIVLLDSCSKTFAMTGWRCGFAAVPAPLREPLTRFFINSTSCVPPFVQRAAVAALTGPLHEVQTMVDDLPHPPRRHRRAPRRPSRGELPGPAGRVLRLPRRLRHGDERRPAGRAAARRGGGGGARRLGVRHAGRGPSADLVCGGAPAHRGRAGPVCQATGVIVAASAHDHAETVRRLLAALGERGLTVFARIDHAAAAREAGLELAEEQVVVFGNARAGTPLMQDDPRIGIELPLRMLVWSDADGGAHVGYTDPRELGARYDVAAHAATLEAMAELLAALAQAASGATPAG